MLNRPVLVDTGALLAAYNTTDPYHAACRRQMMELPLGKAYTCWPVITEASYMLRKQQNQRFHLFDMLVNGDLTLLTLEESDLPAVSSIFSTYNDQQLDLADACLLHLANRESIDTVFTVDRRHFQLFRKADGNALTLLPEQLNP